MAEAYIIDAVRTPRGIGKVGKGSLAHLHPQHLGATVLSAIRDRNNLDTATVDDVIWGTSSQRGAQGANSKGVSTGCAMGEFNHFAFGGEKHAVIANDIATAQRVKADLFIRATPIGDALAAVLSDFAQIPSTTAGSGLAK
mgnify:CR=1 FL=1